MKVALVGNTIWIHRQPGDFCTGTLSKQHTEALDVEVRLSSINEPLSEDLLCRVAEIAGLNKAQLMDEWYKRCLGELPPYV